MTTKFLVLDGDTIVDGEFKDHEGVIRTLPHCDVGAVLWSIDLGTNYGHMTEVTLSMIKDLYHAWTRAEIEGSPLLSSYISLPLSREQQRADDEERERDIEVGR